MFSITKEAEVYMAEIFEQQDEQGLALQVGVEK
ncbi:MAG: Fe/S biogenesis protein NfuA, partial [Candidatus Marinimicrobia bacterium]|nr:Fe/S biogenesis protein NfuA [Candidatus Neomarinimicrobiota bacterium]